MIILVRKIRVFEKTDVDFGVALQGAGCLGCVDSACIECQHYPIMAVRSRLLTHLQKLCRPSRGNYIPRAGTRLVAN